MKTSKTYFVILVFLLVTGNAFAQRDTVIMQESVKLTGKVDNRNRKIGKWIGNNKSGTKIFEASYLDDKIEGNIKRWDESGRITEDYNISQSKKNGKYTSWSYTGQDYKMESGEYLNNDRNGLWITKNSKKLVESEISYKNGQFDGSVKMYYPSQKLKSHLHFRNDSLFHHCEYFENGDLQLEFTSNGTKKTGIVKSYYPNNKPKLQGRLDEGKKVGRWYSYDEAGKKTSEDFLVVTKEGFIPRNNVICHYLKDGTLEYTEHYDSYFSDCTTLTYYDSSRKAVSTKYKKDGKIISEKEYEKKKNEIGKILLNAIEKSKAK
jgi:antitoxin component YwqK of YwqJK toxin-antitoxin module